MLHRAQGCAFFAALLISGALVSAQDTPMRSEVVTMDAVDVWVSRLGDSASALVLEARNRSKSDVRVKGKILAVDVATGNAITQCEYDLLVPMQTFISKKTKCSLSGANALQVTIDEPAPKAE